MRKHFIVSLILFLGLSVCSSYSFEVTLLGPKRYVRIKGEPNVYIDTFPGRNGMGTLAITNEQVSSAKIWINEEQVLGTNDFNQKVNTIKMPINLSESNIIKIELRSKPNSYLIIKVKQEIKAEGGAVVGFDGGTIQVTESSSPLYGVKLEIPPGALSETVVFSINEPSFIPPIPEDFISGENPIELQPSGLIFYENAKLTIPANGLSERMFYIYDETEELWESLETTFDADTDNFEIQISHSSIVNWICNQLSRAYLCTPFEPCTTVTFNIKNVPSNAPGYSETQIKDNIRNAINSWEAALAGGLYFEETEESNADIKFFWSKELRFFIDKNIIALRTVDPITGSQEIKLNDFLTWSAGYYDLDGKKWSIETIALHEIGHVLGLTHHCLYGLKECWGCIGFGPVMAPFQDNSLEPPCVVLHENDISRIQDLYGTCEINKVPNPSFEEGTGIWPNGWEPIYPNINAAYIWDNIQAHMGSRSVGITHCSGPFLWIGWITTEFIPVDASKTCILSGWYYWSDNPNYDEHAAPFIYFYDSEGNYLSGHGWWLPEEKGLWKNFQYSINCPSNTAKIKISLDRYYYSTTNFDAILWFDDIKLIQK